MTETRIVQLANFHSPTSGGLRVAVDQLRAGYQARGIPTVAVLPGPRDETTDDVHRLRSPRLPNGTGYRVIVRRRALLARLDELRPSALEVHDKLLQRWVWPWSRRHGVSLVAVSHERLTDSIPLLLPGLPAGLTGRVLAGTVRRTGARADALVTCSRFAAEEFGANPRVRVIPLGVDLTTFHPGAGQPNRARPSGEPIQLVLASRLSPEKRPDLAIETLRELLRRDQPARLLILGHGPELTRLQGQAAGLPVSFGGFQPDQAAVAARLAAADVVLAPGPVETFGLTALEALACGTPIVVAAGAATEELLTPEVGRSAPLTPQAFAGAVLAVLAGEEAPRRSAARRRAEQFSWDATVNAMLELHRAVELAAAGQ